MNIKPNEIVELQTADGSGNTYRTRLEDVRGDQLLVAAPIHHGEIVPIRVGTALHVSFKADQIKAQGKYRASSIVESRLRGRVPQLLLRLTSDWERFQERGFVRMDVLLDGQYAPLQEEGHGAARPCQITNLSGGGALIVANERLDEEGQIWIAMELDDTVVESSARVIRACNSNEDNYAHGIAFIDIEEESRKAIIQYVFKKQLELRRKGLVGEKPKG